MTVVVVVLVAVCLDGPQTSECEFQSQRSMKRVGVVFSPSGHYLLLLLLLLADDDQQVAHRSVNCCHGSLLRLCGLLMATKLARLTCFDISNEV